MTHLILYILISNKVKKKPHGWKIRCNFFMKVTFKFYTGEERAFMKKAKKFIEADRNIIHVVFESSFHNGWRFEKCWIPTQPWVSPPVFNVLSSYNPVEYEFQLAVKKTGYNWATFNIIE